ncbi:AP2 domain-containing protein [Streptococcus suis]|nr:AP2 domain-containing protein [Streptococcus suis]NQN32905.1 AP2 domain-containing protein [Streptococcus suis]NQO50412.1 AP2 domain-containing protein [Streptococcus suis]NQP50940.1 AP2 domain-containing protein [Streptococcus suis]
MKKVDLTGQVFGRLTVLGDVGKRTKNKGILWHCMCECGQITFVKGANLKNGDTRSCGCLNREARSKRRTKDLSGYENENFIVLKKGGSRNSRVDWLCRCKHCNGTTELNSNEIEATKSCGCLKKGASKEYMASILDTESLKSTKPTAKSTTGVRGVYYRKSKNTYQAFINVDKKPVYLGSSKDFEKAVALRKDAEKKYGYKDPKSK